MPRVATSLHPFTAASASYTSNLVQSVGAFLSLFGKSTRASIFDSSVFPNSSGLTYSGGSCSVASHIPSTVRPVLFSSRPWLQIVSMSSSSAGETNLPYRYRFPRPAVTVDCLIYTLEEGEPWILLIKRKNDPFKGSWALPGGFVDENEGLEVAARRELEEETGVTDSSLVQTGAYGDPGRDPRGHTITVAFMAWASSRASCRARAGDDAAEAEFFPVKRLPKMAFDHLKIISDSWTRCHFRSEASHEGKGHDLAVVDRASGKTLIAFPTNDIGAETLGSVQPTEL